MNDRLEKGTHPSRLELESWMSGEPDSSASMSLGAHLDSCPDCAARVAGMRAQGDRFQFRNPSFAALAARRRRPSWAARLWLQLSRPGKPVAAFATLALTAAGVMLWSAHQEAERSQGVKGAPAFLLFDSRRNLWEAGDTAKVSGGDTLQLALTSETPVHYRIFSRAEDGKLGELMPLPGEPDTLAAGRKGPALPHSLIFSAPVRPERIICVWSRRPLDWQAARALLDAKRAASEAGVDSFQVVGTP